MSQGNIDPKSFWKISYGLYILTSKDGEKANGQIANAVCQVTAKPAQIAIAVNKDNLTHSYVAKRGAFSISVLEQDTPMEFIANWGFQSGRDADKFSGVNFKKSKDGLWVVVQNCVSAFELEVKSHLDVGTHTIFVGEVYGGEVFSDKPVLTYDYYQNVKKGTAPKAAPTYKEVKEVDDTKKCNVCGYIYDPKEGDPKANIPAGTPFSDLPDDWTCPVCGASKDDFG